MIVENINYMNKNHREIYQWLKGNESKECSPVQVVSSKSGLSTLMVNRLGNQFYIHSKYNPIQESERIFKRYEDKILEHKNIFLYGIGLGYHVEIMMERFPEKNYFLYEPDLGIFNTLLNTRELSEIVHKAKYELLIPKSKLHSEEILHNISKELDDEILLIAHPSYEQLFMEDFQSCMLQFKRELSNRKFGLSINAAFQKRWTLNCVKNLKFTLNTPNVLSTTLENNPLRKKPVLLISAGPSLNEELPYIEQIKKDGTAYIFAVGSANKVLLKNKIEPDAVCTYDPLDYNYEVFEDMINAGINHIPMFYGTSVGYETLEKYKGPKLHMVTSQDIVTPYFLDKTPYYIVEDAPSIAVVILQLLLQLEASQIILVGQNLGYRDSEFYAKGIQIDNRTQEIVEQDKINPIIVKSVTGSNIYTNEGFFKMKESFEYYLQKWKEANVINTTVNGANIEGAPFIPLKTVMEEILTIKIVEDKWFKDFSPMELDEGEIFKKMEHLKGLQKIHSQTVNELIDIIKKINMNQNSSEGKLDKLYYKLDKRIKRLENNEYYSLFIQPIMKIEREQVKKASREIKIMDSAKKKAPKILTYFGKFVQNLALNSNYMEPAFLELETGLQSLWKDK